MENPNLHSSTEVTPEQAFDLLISLRDNLVELSQSLQDLLFMIDVNSRNAAEEATCDVLNRLNR
jgi:hypothetical protein